MSLSVDEGKALVTDFCKSYPSALQVRYKIRSTQEELFNAKETIESAGKIFGAYFPASNVAGFATSNFRDENEFKDTLRHEILGHFGLNTFNAEEKRLIVTAIAKAKDQPGLVDLWAGVDSWYPNTPELLKAEEVYAFACEAINTKDLVNTALGEKSLREVCFDQTRPMQLNDLINITNLVADGMRQGVRQQQNFPLTDQEQFKRGTDMEPKKPFHEVVAENLIKQLETNTAPWQKPWEPGQAGFMPINPTTGNRYKGINAIQLMSQNHDDNRWMTYKQAEAVGAQVRKGEKGTPVQYWKFSEEQNKLDDQGKPVLDGNNQPVKVTVQLERPRVFMATVFNAEQIDGLPPLQIKEPVQAWEANERAERILSASGANINHSDSNRAFYRSSTDSIHLPEKSQFPNEGNYYATALHELGHWTGHETRLSRDLANPFGSEAYAKEELRAEIASMILGDEIGIGHDPEQHVSYVKSWINVLKQDPMEIFRAAADAEKIQNYVLALEQKQELTHEISEYHQTALNYLEHHYGVNELTKEHTAFLTNSAQAGDAPIVGALELAETFKLKLTTEGLNYSVAQNLVHNEENIRNDHSIAFVYQGYDESTGMNKYIVNVEDSPYKHVIGVDFKNNTAELFQTIAKSTNETMAPNQEQFLNDLNSLSTMTQRNARIDSALEAYAGLDKPAAYKLDAGLDSDINLVLQDKNLTFDHFVSFDKAQGSLSLEDTLRDHGLSSISSITGNDPQKFYDTALERLSPVFGIPVDYEKTDNAYLERKGLVQAFSNQAESLFHSLQEQENLSMATPPPIVPTIEDNDEPRLWQLDDDTEEYGKRAGWWVVVSADEENELSLPIETEEAAEVERQRVYAQMQFAAALKEKNYSEMDANAPEAFGFSLPHDWNGVVQIQGNIIEGVGNDQVVLPASDRGIEPQFYSLYAQLNDGTYEHLEDYPEEIQALVVKENIETASAELESELEKTAKLARIHEQRVRRDPNSTDDEIITAKENRKDAEMNAMLNDSELQKEIAETEKQYKEMAADLNSQAAKKTDTEITYIKVPYAEKEAVKSLGAKWDRKEQSWYVPPGLNLEPFAKWTQGASQVAPAAISESSQGQPTGVPAQGGSGRVYLAVPYGEREAAKLAGAQWDKTAKSWYVGDNPDSELIKRWLPENVTAQQGPAKTPEEEFADALRSVGCIVPPNSEHPIMDGKKHRIETNGDKNGEKSGFYVGHLDGHPAGYIKNNKTSVDIRWKSKGYSLSDEEKAKLSAEAATKLAQRDANLERTQQQTATRIETQISSLVPITQPTPYLADKGIQAHAGALTDKEGKTTFIPAQDINGKVWTMQYISEDGTKRFAKDSKKEGCFHVVGGMDDLAKAPAIVVGEGYATATTASESLGFATVAAFDSGNLLKVVKDLHEKFPDKPVIVIGDDDRHLLMTQGVNVGKEKASAAANEVGGKAIFPVFTPKEQSYPTGLAPVTPEKYRKNEISTEQREALSNIKKFTDFNDLSTKSELGKEGVHRQLNTAVNKVIEETITHREAQALEASRKAPGAKLDQEQEVTKKRSSKIA